MKAINYSFFIDETGDHGLTYVDANFPLFVLCGCLFEEKDLENAKQLIDKFKLKYFKTTEVFLHSRDIRKCEGAFQILFDLGLKKSFYEDLNKIIEEINFKVISAAINKEEFIKRYGKCADDPYHISFSFVMERIIFCTDSLGKNIELTIIPEKRGRREDDMFIAHYNSIMDSGTYHVNSRRFKQRIKHLEFCRKLDNLVGSQIADLSAYPIARYVLNPQEPYIPFSVVKDKIYRSLEGKIDGYGLKVFP